MAAKHNEKHQRKFNPAPLFFPPLFKSGLDRFFLAYMIRGVTVRTLLKILPTFWPETHLYPPPSPVNHVGISISGKQKLHTASNFVFTGRRSAGGHQQCPMICWQERVSMGSASSLIYIFFSDQLILIILMQKIATLFWSWEKPRSFMKSPTM